MVKLKRRYLLVEVLLSSEHAPINETELYHAVMNQLAALHGDYGIGAIRQSFQVRGNHIFWKTNVL